jgi:hypothetical protein
MAKNLLHDADVRALLDQQARGCMPGIVDSGVWACACLKMAVPRR